MAEDDHGSSLGLPSMQRDVLLRRHAAEAGITIVGNNIFLQVET